MDLSEYYDGLTDQIRILETERDSQTASLRSQIERIEDAYNARLQGLQKALDGISEAMQTIPVRSDVRPLVSTLTVTRYPRTQDVLRTILKEEATQKGLGMTLEALAEEAARRGARIESQKPPQAVRSSLYAMKEKGEPIVLIGPGTWSWAFTNDEEPNETQTAATA